MQKAAPYIALAALLAVAFLLKRVGELEDRLQALATGRPAVAMAATAAPAPVEVAQNMGRIQAYANKMWSAGQAGNLPLVDFYRHEMKEEMEAVANGGVVDDGVPVSEHMKTYGIRAMEALKADLKANGLTDFNDQYAVLISTCNSCHVTCGHPELRMRIPSVGRYTDQEFAP